MTINVLIVDSRRLFRDVLPVMLGEAEGFRVVGVASAAAMVPAAARAEVALVGEADFVPAPDGIPAYVSLEGQQTWDNVLLALVRAAAHRRPPAAAGPASGSSPLTDREVVTLGLVSQGLSAAQAAAELGVSPRTVEARTQSAMNKLGVHSQSQAVARCLELGLLGRPRPWPEQPGAAAARRLTG